MMEAMKVSLLFEAKMRLLLLKKRLVVKKMQAAYKEAPSPEALPYLAIAEEGVKRMDQAIQAKDLAKMASSMSTVETAKEWFVEAQRRAVSELTGKS